MGHYIVLIKLSGATAEKAGELPEIMRGIAAAWNIVGSDVQVHAVNGPYDLVVQGEAAEPIDVAWLGAGLAESGVSTCSMQAFTVGEIELVFQERPLERKYPVRPFK